MVAALFARQPRISLEYAWLIGVVILQFYLLVDLMRRGLRWQQWIIEGLLLTGALFILIAIAEMIMWYFGTGPLPRFAQGWPSLYGWTLPPIIHEVSLPLNHNNPTGAYCLLVIPMAVAGSMTLRQPDLRWALRGIALGMTVVLLLTRSRGAMIGLAAMVGLSILVWLLKADTRQRFPRGLRPLLRPRLLIGATVLVGLIGAALVFAVMIRNRDANSISRLDLWLAAIEMIPDHPLTGVGPRQFGGERLDYLHWRYSYSYLPLQHAHSLPLHWLAEGGAIVLVFTLWLLDRLRRTWWTAWQGGNSIRRRRLEGALIALLAFATHSLVDTFLQVQLMTPLLIIAAYIVAGDAIHTSASPPPTPTPSRWRRRWLPAIVLIALLAAQFAFIPLHRGIWAHHRALAAMDTSNWVEALAAIRDAQEADPWNDLYRLQEAIILGELADDHPQVFLNDAIATFEDALARSPRWDLGWHNLAALYAQAGRYEDAIDAEESAIELDSILGGYYLKLGEYYELAGDPTQAEQAYIEALERLPDVASSGFWTDPAFPQRAAMLDRAIAQIAPDKPWIALDVAVYAGKFDTARAIIDQQQARPLSDSLKIRLAALWPLSNDGDPCWRCYKVARTVPNGDVRRYLVQAEWLLTHSPEFTPEVAAEAEKAARTAIFLSENQAGWSWYVLARLAEANGGDPATIDRWLAESVRHPNDYRTAFATTVYTIRADLHVLPQAQTPILSALSYEPWLRLAERYEAGGAWDEARRIYERILADDPYAQNIRALLQALPPPRTP